jgi:double-stranded uracil-DNA glycosylase
LDKLPDVLCPGLNIVFCGTAAVDNSARKGCYYAGPGNKFWATLAEVGLRPRRMNPEEFRDLPNYKLGLTDLAKKISGLDATLRSRDFDVAGLEKRLIAASPKVVAFNGKKAAAAFLDVEPQSSPWCLPSILDNVRGTFFVWLGHPTTEPPFR